MGGRHALPSRLESMYREIAKFGLVGLLGFVVNLVVFNLWFPSRMPVYL
jgi:putative flippase GtrA